MDLQLGVCDNFNVQCSMFDATACVRLRLCGGGSHAEKVGRREADMTQLQVDPEVGKARDAGAIQPPKSLLCITLSVQHELKLPTPGDTGRIVVCGPVGFFQFLISLPDEKPDERACGRPGQRRGGPGSHGYP